MRALSKNNRQDTGVTDRMMEGQKKHIEDMLREQEIYIATTVGTSMYPMLRNRRDTVVIRPCRGRLHKYDIPLYKRGDKYILHRIVKVLPEGYIICGDNCLHLERDITDAQILGVLTEFYRDGRQISMTGIGYQLYCRIWTIGYPLRAAWKKLHAALRKVRT